MNTIRAGRAALIVGSDMSSVVQLSLGYCVVWALGLSGVLSGALWNGSSGTFSVVCSGMGLQASFLLWRGL